MIVHAATDNDIFPPRFGGAERAFGLLRGLARRHTVRALCVVPNRNEAAAEETAAGVTLVRRKAWYTSLAWRLERARLAPLAVAYDWHTRAARGLLAALPGTPDVLCADLPLAGLLAASRARLRVHTSHNVEVDHFLTTGAHLFASAAWRARVREAEARAVETADLTVVCSGEDAERMRALHGADAARLHVAPNGYDETRVTVPDDAARAVARARFGLAERERVALFVGSDVPHNRESLAFLLERVGPALPALGARLLVAGSVTRALGARREPWLVTVPEAPDLTPVLHAADVGLNPAASGGGSNVKLPTYLAAGLAVVTTPFGLRGYPDLAPHVVVAERDETVEALRSAPAGARATGAGRAAAVEAYAWGTIGARLGEVLESLGRRTTEARDPEGERA